MPKTLKRYYDQDHLHFITFSCYRRLSLLGPARTRKVLLQSLREVRVKYNFALVGYDSRRLPAHWKYQDA